MRDPPSPKLRRIKGGDEAAKGRRHAEGHGIPPAVPPQGFRPAKPLGSQFANRELACVPCLHATSHIAICEVDGSQNEVSRGWGIWYN